VMNQGKKFSKERSMKPKKIKAGFDCASADFEQAVCEIAKNENDSDEAPRWKICDAG